MCDFISPVVDCLLSIARPVVENLDKHQGFYMVCLTAALVIFAWKSARAAARNIELIKQNDDKRTFPYVALEVVNDMPFYGVRMVNRGATAAHNVVVKAEPNIEMVFPNYRKPIRFLHEPVAYIAPSANFATDIGGINDIENANPSKVYTGTICFENDEGKKFEHEFVLDFTPFSDAVHKEEKTIHHVVHQLENLNREISSLATGVHTPHVLTEDFYSHQENEFKKGIDAISEQENANRQNGDKIRDALANASQEGKPNERNDQKGNSVL